MQEKPKENNLKISIYKKRKIHPIKVSKVNEQKLDIKN